MVEGRCASDLHGREKLTEGFDEAREEESR